MCAFFFLNRTMPYAPGRTTRHKPPLTYTQQKGSGLSSQTKLICGGSAFCRTLARDIHCGIDRGGVEVGAETLAIRQHGEIAEYKS